MDLTRGSTHVIYLLPYNSRDLTKVKGAAMCQDSPSMLYVPPGGSHQPPTEMEIVIGYMDPTTYGWVWCDQPLKCAIVPTEREARLMNRQRSDALKPPPPAAASTASTSAPSPADDDALAEVLKYVKPVAEQPKVRKLLEASGLGVRVFECTSYTVLRSMLQLEPAVCCCLLQALHARRAAKVKELLVWDMVLADLPDAARREASGKCDLGTEAVGRVGGARPNGQRLTHMYHSSSGGGVHRVAGCHLFA